METKFNSQICTTREQSERLLALGLKKETADMWYPHFAKTCPLPLVDEVLNSDDIPAWSLSRLLELNLLCCEQHFAFQFHITNIDNAYEYFINHTEWLIKEGYFNKEYLNEC